MKEEEEEEHDQSNPKIEIVFKYQRSRVSRNATATTSPTSQQQQQQLSDLLLQEDIDFVDDSAKTASAAAAAAAATGKEASSSSSSAPSSPQNHTAEFQTKVETARQLAEQLGEPWSHVDWSLGRADSCGIHKCFFRMYNNNNNDNDTDTTITTRGLLVSQGALDYEKMKRAYWREKYLHDTYGIPTLALEEPHYYYSYDGVANQHEELIALLEAYVYHPGYDSDDNDDSSSNEKEEDDEYYDLERDLVVQQVVRVPEPSLVVGFSQLKERVMYQQLPAFCQGIGHEHGQDFTEKFQQERNRTLTMVQDPQHLYLLHDFQVMIDVTGTFYHIDLDRSQLPKQIMNGGNGKKLEKMVQHLDKKLQTLLEDIWAELDDTLKKKEPVHGGS
jgi:hypothetical protein